MAIAMSDLRTVSGDGPPRVIIYGPEGVGKTTLASEFPNPVFLQTESGTPRGLQLRSLKDPNKTKLESFGEVMEAIGAVYTDPQDRQTLVVDSISELQKLVFAETCARGDEKGNSKGNIEDFGYGKGYVYAMSIWQEILDGLNAVRRDHGLAIVLIAHAVVERFNDPETVSYDRYSVAVQASDKSGADHRGLIQREMDAILLLKPPISIEKEDLGFKKERAIAKGGSTIIIHTTGKPAFVAKNRYGMPPTIPFDVGKGFDALAPYFAGLATAEAEPEPEQQPEPETQRANGRRSRQKEAA